ncbi:hypothetical protein [Priestia koreensis]|uniref:hypothetical protein n=1 Tax=Priestia koreensis TaxID=284581 RepID=UPI002040B778|nr:hypothetical protein [Priestia koreensis]MCM3004155.1 hypothetical protein [Priestia koreensis]
MEFKYKDHPLWKVAGGIWMFVLLADLGVMYFSFGDSATNFTWILPLFSIVTMILCLMAAFFSFRVQQTDYVRIKNETIFIHKGPIRPRQKIKLVDLKESRIIGEQLVLILRNENEVAINLRQLSIINSERLQQALKECIVIR